MTLYEPPFYHAVSAVNPTDPPSVPLGLNQSQEMTASALDAIVLLGDSITQGGWEAGGFSQQLACKPAGRNKSLYVRTSHLPHFVR